MSKNSFIFMVFAVATGVLGTIQVKQQIDLHKTQAFVHWREGADGFPVVIKKFDSSLAKVNEMRSFDGSKIEPDIKYHAISGCYLPTPGPTPTPGPIPEQPAQQVDWSVVKVHAQNLSIKGDGIKTCVLDTGVDLRHPDLKISKAISVVDNDPQDFFGHGSHVSGIIAAQDNAIGTVGIAPGVTLISIKVLGNDGSGNLSGIADGVNKAVNELGCEVLNLSLGGSQGSEMLYASLKAASDKGVLISVAAGNENSFTGFPAQYKIPNLWSVAALDKDNKKTSFSNFGKIEIAAPGLNMLSLTPVGFKSAMGDGSGYTVASGTSMAAPVVAGIMSLAKQAAKQLKAIPIGDAYYFGIGQADAGVTLE